jgi:D-amino-acid dehydrogenase
MALAGRLGLVDLGFERLSTGATVALEPALAPIADQLCGSLFYPDDESGNAHHFSVALAALGSARGIDFRFGIRVDDFEVSHRSVQAVMAGRARFAADRVVIAAGVQSPALLAKLGIRVPIRPVKGYSLTFDRPVRSSSIGVPIVDDARHAVLVPVGDTLRVAGVAEFAGFDARIRRSTIDDLARFALSMLPEARLDASTARPWCGFRPMSVDGVPIIGKTPLDNLLVNIAHGHLGWTMAAGSADLIARLVNKTPAALDLFPFSLARF